MSDEKHVKIIFENGEWKPIEKAEGGPDQLDWTWGVWNDDFGYIPDFYYSEE